MYVNDAFKKTKQKNIISSLARTSFRTGFWLNLNFSPCKIKFLSSGSLGVSVCVCVCVCVCASLSLSMSACRRTLVLVTLSLKYAQKKGLAASLCNVQGSGTDIYRPAVSPVLSHPPIPPLQLPPTPCPCPYPYPYLYPCPCHPHTL